MKNYSLMVIFGCLFAASSVLADPPPEGGRHNYPGESYVAPAAASESSGEFDVKAACQVVNGLLQKMAADRIIDFDNGTFDSNSCVQAVQQQILKTCLSASCPPSSLKGGTVVWLDGVRMIMIRGKNPRLGMTFVDDLDPKTNTNRTAIQFVKDVGPRVSF